MTARSTSFLYRRALMIRLSGPTRMTLGYLGIPSKIRRKNPSDVLKTKWIILSPGSDSTAVSWAYSKCLRRDRQKLGGLARAVCFSVDKKSSGFRDIRAMVRYWVARFGW